jgi:hemin uptake protein HemP
MRDEQIATQKNAPAYTTDALFKGTREIEIEHNGEVYRLRITRQGKLILNK